jgi:hypothetical protein
VNVQDAEVFAGEDRTLTFEARDASNLPANLSAKTVSWMVGRDPRNLDSSWPAFTKSGTVTDAAAGLFTVPVTPADTRYLAGDYRHQAETTDAQSRKAIVTIGRFRVRATMGSS